MFHTTLHLLGNSPSPYPGLWHPCQQKCHLELFCCQPGQGGNPRPIIWEGWVGWRPSPSFCQCEVLVPTLPWAPLPSRHPRGPNPLTTHEGSLSPPSLACPLLLRPCGHGCVWWLGGAAVPGNQARSVCLVGGRTEGSAPLLPSFPPPPQAPLTVRPARPAKPVGSSLETGP